MELTEDLSEVLVGLKHDDETDGPRSPSVMEVPLLNSGLVVTIADGAWRIDATTPVICCTTTGNKPLVKNKLVHVDMEMSGMHMDDCCMHRLLGDEREIVCHDSLKIHMPLWQRYYARNYSVLMNYI